MTKKELVDEIMKASEDYPNVILYMESLMENYEQLKDNWNKLKEWLEEESKLKGTETAYLYYGRVKDKMQEIKGDKNV